MKQLRLTTEQAEVVSQVGGTMASALIAAVGNQIVKKVTLTALEKSENETLKVFTVVGAMFATAGVTSLAFKFADPIANRINEAIASGTKVLALKQGTEEEEDD